MAFVGQAHGNDACHSEVCSVGQARYEAGCEKHPIVGREHGDDGSGHHHGGEDKQYRLGLVFVGKDEQWCACAHAYGVG